jgi:hypothetical protein
MEGYAVTRQRATEPGLDGAPAAVGVLRRQGPNGVNVIWEDDDRINGERPLAAHGPKDGSQYASLGGKTIGPSVAQRDGEEVGRAGNTGAAVVDHE